MDDNELKQMVAEIHKALVGDQYREEGLIKKVEKHEQRLLAHDKKFLAIDKITYKVIGAYLVLFFLLLYGEKLLEIIK